MKKASGLADVLAQPPVVSAAFGRWPGFVLMMTAMFVVLALSVVMILVASKSVVHLLG